jgi:alpha-glucosidase
VRLSRFAFAAVVAVSIGAILGLSLSEQAEDASASASVPAASVARTDAAVLTPPESDPEPATTQVAAALPAAIRVPIVTDEAATQLSIVREDGRTFSLTRPGSTTVRVTFLTPQTFRIHALGNEPPVNLPEYIRVKSDESYPPVDVRLETRDYSATLKTQEAAVQLVLAEDGILVSVTTPAGTLVKNWKINLGRRAAVLDLEPDEHIYGFGDKRAALDQRGNKVEIINRDAFASENNESYKSIPFYISSNGYGLFLNNFYPSVFDVGAWYRNRLQVTATGGDMDFYVFVGEPSEVISQYTELTGRPAMLPRWAFGYHQGKASYEGRQAFTVASEMRKRKLPIDVIYYDGWDDEATTKSFIDSLWSQHHVRLTLGFGMPMFGRYPGSDDGPLLNELGSRHFLMVDQNGRPSIAPDQHVDSSEEKSAVGYLDYFSPSAVDHIFKAKWNEAIRNGAILGMIDFGEMDHIRNTESKFWPSVGLSVAQSRNLYGLVYPLSIIDAVQKRTGGSGRITGMVRPGFAGTQRLGWSTTGDSLPTYRNFRAHTRAMINLALSGFSNVGQDIGGWDSKGPDILYARWFAAGTFHPFMWSHGQGDHEPYAHGEEVEAAARDFLNLRYRLVPYLYSLHEAAHRTGVPMLRSFPMQEPAEPSTYRIDDQYFVGDDLMVAPLFNDKGDRKVYLPKGLWYDFFAEQPPEAGGREVERTSVPLNRLPVYVRAGAVIPLGPLMQYTAEKPVDPLTVHVYSFSAEDTSDDAQSGEFDLYEDDGRSNDYQNGKFQRTQLHFEQSKSAIKFEIKAESGDGRYWAVPARAYALHFHGVHTPPKGVALDGQEIARADVANSARSDASWHIDETSGDVIVSIPRSAKRSFAVTFATAPAWTCGGRC